MTIYPRGEADRLKWQIIITKANHPSWHISICSYPCITVMKQSLFSPSWLLNSTSSHSSKQTWRLTLIVCFMFSCAFLCVLTVVDGELIQRNHHFAHLNFSRCLCSSASYILKLHKCIKSKVALQQTSYYTMCNGVRVHHPHLKVNFLKSVLEWNGLPGNYIEKTCRQ